MREQLIAPIRAEIKPGMSVGIGTGSTVEIIIRGLGKEVFENITCVTTSLKTDLILREFGVVALHNEVIASLDFAFDGADFVTKELATIKGNGGALLNEKIVASKARRFAIVADEKKVVSSLDGRLIPVEIVREGLAYVIEQLKSLGATAATLRESTSGMYGPVITEHGNVIVDVRFEKISQVLERSIKQIVGVVECGLFISQASVAYISTSKGLQKL